MMLQRALRGGALIPQSFLIKAKTPSHQLKEVAGMALSISSLAFNRAVWQLPSQLQASLVPKRSIGSCSVPEIVKSRFESPNELLNKLLKGFNCCQASKDNVEKILIVAKRSYQELEDEDLTVSTLIDNMFKYKNDQLVPSNPDFSLYSDNAFIVLDAVARHPVVKERLICYLVSTFKDPANFEMKMAVLEKLLTLPNTYGLNYNVPYIESPALLVATSVIFEGIHGSDHACRLLNLLLNHGAALSGKSSPLYIWHILSKIRAEPELTEEQKTRLAMTHSVVSALFKSRGY